MVSAILSVVLALDSAPAQDGAFFLKSRQHDVASLVQSIHDFTGKPVVLYFDEATQIPNLNHPIQSEEEMSNVLRKNLRMEMHASDEGIAIGPIAPEKSEYLFSGWSSMPRRAFAKQLEREMFPRTEEFSFGSPTYCVPINFQYATQEAVTIHPMYNLASLCIIGDDLTFESTMRLIAPAVAGRFLYENETYYLEPDPQAILIRMNSVSDRFTSPSGEGLAIAMHVKYLLTARLLANQIGKDRIDTFLSQSPGVYTEDWAISSLDTETAKLANEYITLMGHFTMPHLPNGTRDVTSVSVSLSPYSLASIVIIRTDGQRIVF